MNYFPPSPLFPIPVGNAEIMGLSGAAYFLGGIKEELLKELVEAKQIPCRRIGDAFIFSKKRLIEWAYTSPRVFGEK